MSTKTNMRVILALTLVHFTGDFYSAFTTPLFPLLVEKLGLSLTQVGIIAGLNRFLAFIVQPSAGYLADRYPSRLFTIGGLVLAVVFIPLCGVASGFWTLLAVIALGSVGSSLFHPAVTGMVPIYAGRRAGLSMSIFNTGGTLAFGLGPLFITWYAVRFGLGAVPLTMVLGLVLALYLFLTLPAPPAAVETTHGFLATLRVSLGPAWKAVALIWLVMVLRALTGQSFLTFMPLLYVQEGHSLVSAGLIFALFTVAGTFSGILAGMLSDRIGPKPVFLITHGLMTPVLLLFLHLEGHWVYAGALLAGGFVLATLPLGVVMAQTLAPHGRSMVASLMMGFAFGLGGLVSPLVGYLADIYSIRAVLTAASLVPLVTVALIARFPNITAKGAL
ncbi:MAG: MFS transporter [Desulfobacterales bacterium]|jgi:FSR family fosmidomycin resistance protein-like MFS transporter